MNTRKWSTRLLVRYGLLQLPGLALLVLILIFIQRWVGLPPWIVCGSIAIWVVKDAILYPFIWRAYDQQHSEGANSLVGARGIVKERLAPSGYVQVRGELWKAELIGDIPPVARGEPVRVRQTRGLTLLVQPWDEEAKNT